MVDNACTALSFIAEAFAGDAKRLELLNTHGLINQAIQLVRCPALRCVALCINRLAGRCRPCAADSGTCRLRHVL